MGSSGIDWKLPDHPKLPKGKAIGPIFLYGWGEVNADQYNCIHVAETPVMDSLKKGAPEIWRLVRAHGTAVGLPTEDDMGNSEVRYNALGGVHSRLDQLLLLLKGVSEQGAKRIRVHILTDGCDVLDGSSVEFAEILENDLAKLREKGVDAQVASGGGHMYVTMDRYENDWSVVKRGWDAQALGEAPYKFKNVVEAIKTLRAEPVPIALTALDSPELTQGSAMRLVGHSDKLPIQVLVDSGADLNFLNPSVAVRLGLCIDHSLKEPVAVANGDICYTQGIASNFTVKLQDYTFCSDIRLLSVQGCDLVLGAEWLETLGFIGWHFRHKVMEFQIEGHNYRLVGLRSLDSPPTLPPSPFDSSMPNIDSLLASLLSASSPLAAAHPIPPPLTSLLDAPFDNPLWPTLVI